MSCQLDWVFPKVRSDAIFHKDSCDAPLELLFLDSRGDNVSPLRVLWIRAHELLYAQGQEQAVATAVEMIADGMLKHYSDASGHELNSHCWSGALQAVRTHLSESHPLFKPVLIKSLITASEHFQSGATLVNAIVPRPKEGAGVQDVLDYLYQCGQLSDAEIAVTWEQMITTRYRSGIMLHFLAQLWENIYFPPQCQHVAELTAREILFTSVSRLMRGHTNMGCTRIWENCSQECAYGVPKLLSLAGKSWVEEDFRPWVEGQLITTLSRGHIGTVSFFVSRFGRQIGLSGGGCSMTEDVIKSLAAQAYPRAKRELRYGVAAALAEYCGDQAAAADLRALAARRMQLVELKQAVQGINL